MNRRTFMKGIAAMGAVAVVPVPERVGPPKDIDFRYEGDALSRSSEPDFVAVEWRRGAGYTTSPNALLHVRCVRTGQGQHVIRYEFVDKPVAPAQG